MDFNFNLDDYPNSIYKTLWLDNPKYSINILNLVSLSDRTETERQEIARQGGTASGKARLKDAYQRQVLTAILDNIRAREQINDIINDYNGRHKSKINIANPETVINYLPLRLLNKINAINNRLQRQRNQIKKTYDRYQVKYNETPKGY